MDFNSYKYLEIDEQDIQKEEEEQHKEIQALLASEFYGLELDDDDDDEEISNQCSPDPDEMGDNSFINDDSRYDKENVFIGRHGLPEQSAPWIQHPVGAFYTGNQLPQPNFINFHQSQTNNNCFREEDASINWDISLHGEMGIPRSQSNNQFYSDKITYMATSNLATKDPQGLVNTKLESPIKKQPSPMKIIKRDVAVECIPVNQRELDNLELLYSARGKRIEQLQVELDSEKEKRLRETRILNHKVTLLESEQKNESNVLKSYKMEVNDLRQSLIEKEGVIEVQSHKIVEFETTVEKLTSTVEARTCLVESLNSQLTELTTRSSMARNNQKQAELLECINYQFDTDAHRFQSEINRLSERVDQKMKENERLQVQLDEQVNFYQTQRRLWTEEKQKICDDLSAEKVSRQKMETSTGQDRVNQLQGQINELTLGKSMAEDMNFYLQEEVLELTNQLLAYEQSLFLLENKDSGCDHDLDASARLMGGRRRSYPMLPDVHGDDGDADRSSTATMLRKEVFSLTNRTHSLTNRLLDVRKDNLDMKTTVKKLQNTINEQNEVLFVLEDKFSKSESRLNQLQSESETDLEKQLRKSNESLETIKKSLELQCNSLLSQLKQANERMEEIDLMRRQSEKDFTEFKDSLEEDKLSEIEDVKRACGNHFDNLRQQLEMSWMTEKDALMADERRVREELEGELSDALAEVDRVKNLYIKYSQQRSTEESNLTNWNEWVTKKLEEQKRSLNQQFQNDLQSKIVALRAEHERVLEGLQSEKMPVQVEDKAEGTEVLVAEVGLQVVQASRDDSSQTCSSVVGVEASAQTLDNNSHEQQIEDLVLTNDKLQSAYNKLKCQVERAEREEQARSSSACSPSMLSSNIHAKDALFPHVIRSCSPQLGNASGTLACGDSQNQRTSMVDLQTLFRSLKEDLVHQLTELSISSQHKDNVVTGECSVESRRNSASAADPLVEFDRMKEHLYKYILEMQARAAVTIQQELRSSQARIRGDLLRQLRHVLPLTLTVDGQMINVAPDKMRVLTDKVSLILDHLQSSDYSPLTHSPFPQARASFNYLPNNQSPRISATSTPLGNHTPVRHHRDLQSDLRSISSDDSSDIISPRGNQGRQGRRCDPMNDTVIRSRCEQLQEEISKLSDDLLRTKTTFGQKEVSGRPQSLFSGVDHTWLCDSIGVSACSNDGSG